MLSSPFRRSGRSVRALRIVSVSALATCLLPGLAAACSTCLGGDTEASRKAFIGTTAFLTFFPLLMLGGLIGWFVRRALAHEREEEARIDAASKAPGSADDSRAVVHPIR